MLPYTLDAIGTGHISRVVQDQWSESETLEFKRELPGASDRDKHEFLKDVCALANNFGGDIMYGIAEEHGVAQRVVPIRLTSWDHAESRLRQILDSGMEPPIIGLQFKTVPVEEGLTVIARVPGSFSTPHRFRTGAGWRSVIRSGTVTVDMTYEQLRSAFDRGGSLANRAMTFRRERLTSIEDGHTWRPMTPPLCVVHLVPLVAMTGRAGISIESIRSTYAELASTASWGGAGFSTNLEGAIVHPGGIGGEPILGYVQVFRSGAYEAAQSVAYDFDDRSRPVPSVWVSRFVRDALQKIRTSIRKHNIVGPALIGIALVGLGGCVFDIGRNRFNPNNARKPDRANLLIPELWIERTEAFNDIDAAARPLLDVLAQSFNVTVATNTTLMAPGSPASETRQVGMNHVTKAALAWGIIGRHIALATF